MNQDRLDEVRATLNVSAELDIPIRAEVVLAILDAWEAEKANDFTDEELMALVSSLRYLEHSDVLGSYTERILRSIYAKAYAKAKAILEARKRT